MSTLAAPQAPAHQDVTAPAAPRGHALPATRVEVAVLATVLLVSVAYVYWHLGRGLVPHDDGAIGHAAERLLQGELPHRDFDDIYTGGLAWLNAFAFRLLGTSFWSMRLMLLAAFTLWVPSVFYIARRFAAPITAGGVTLAAVVWSVPNYPAPMPSWYNLFLATLGAAALLRHLDDPRARWLVAAGVAGGLSMIVKIVGLYYVAGVLLYLVHLARLRSTRTNVAGRGGGAYALTVTTGMSVFVLALFSLVRRGFGAAEMIHFVVPGALLAAFLAHDEWTAPAVPQRDRFGALAQLTLPFLAGIALPVALFLVPYVRSGTVGALLNGVFVLPTRRLSSAAVPMVSAELMWTTLPLIGLTVAAHRWPRSARTAWSCVLGAVALLLGALLIATRTHAALYRDVWSSARSVVPLFTATGVVLLSRAGSADAEQSRRGAGVMLLLCLTALVGIVQFPFAIPVYFCYAAPLVVLLGLALSSLLDARVHVLGGVLLAFYGMFAVTRMNTSSLYGMGYVFRNYPETVRLDSPRGGLDVLREQGETYAAVGHLLRAHGRGEYTWASPDCPEVYFLSGLRNPTRSLFEFFDNPEGQSDRVLRALAAHDVTAIVLNKQPEFSHGITMRLGQALVARYPESADVGKFQVRWRR